LPDAFAQCALAMFGYMTEPDAVKIDAACSRHIDAHGAWASEVVHVALQHRIPRWARM